MEFRWNEWNLEHIERHGVTRSEAEHVVRRAHLPFPVYRGDGKYAVWGAAHGGTLLQVIFVLDRDASVFIIHARPLTDREKRRLQKHRK